MDVGAGAGLPAPHGCCTLRAAARDIAACSSRRARAGSRRRCCTRTAASRTRRRSWPGCTGSRRATAVLAPAPLAHVSGLLNGVLISAAVDGPCVLLDPWDPEEGLRPARDERIAFVGAPPIFFSQMAGPLGFSRERVGALRLISTGGASVSPAFVDSTADAYGCRVKRTYGSTEAPTITTSGPDDPYERARDTDGHPVGEAEISVRDRDVRRRLGPGRGRRALDQGSRDVRGLRRRRADRRGDRTSRRLVPLG